MIWSREELGWPWVCLGGSLVMFALMFGTNFTRSQPATGSRWMDPVWLAWLLVPVLMIHMFEEFGHDVLGRTYFLGTQMCMMLGYHPYPDCPIPRAHYALLNLGVAFVSAPIAASFARRNLIVGLSMSGLVLLNGTFHVFGAIASGPPSFAGVATAASLFLPVNLWICYVVLKTRALSLGALAVALGSGILMHVALIGLLQLPKFMPIGATGFLLLDCVVIALGPILASLGSSLFRSSASGPGRPASAQT